MVPPILVSCVQRFCTSATKLYHCGHGYERSLTASNLQENRDRRVDESLAHETRSHLTNTTINAEPAENAEGADTTVSQRRNGETETKRNGTRDARNAGGDETTAVEHAKT